MIDPKIQKLYEKVITGEGTGDLFKNTLIAGTYDQNTNQVFGRDIEQYKQSIDTLLDLTEYTSQDIIIDLGCGTGISTLQILTKKPKKVIGVDFSEAMLKEAERKFLDKKKVEFKVGNAEELSDIVSKADKIVSVNVFQYISDPDKALKEIYKVLNPNGEYLFNVKVKTPDKQSVYSQMFMVFEEVLSEVLGREIKIPELKGFEPKYDKRELEDLASRNGFAVEKYKEIPSIFDEKILHAMHDLTIGEMEQELKASLCEEKTREIVQKIREKLNKFYTKEGIKAGREAFVCLRKNKNEI